MLTHDEAVFNGIHKMNTPIKPADGGFLRGLLTGIEMPGRQAIGYFHAIGIRKLVSKKMRKDGGGSRRDHGMAAEVFGKWRRLQQRLPVRIDVFANGGFGPDAVAVELFVPATNKRIG